MTKANNDGIVSEETDFEILGADEATYSHLAQEIGSGGNIVLQHDYYKYDNHETITITVDNSVIDGNGAVIDMMSTTNKWALNIDASGVTIKNLSIKDCEYMDAYWGKTVFFSNSGTLINCNFYNCRGGQNGAIHFGGQSDSNVINCTFYSCLTDSGAIYMNSGTVTNCSFTRCSGNDGSAIYMNSGTVTNCNFTSNSASHGVVWMNSGNVTNCNFTNNNPYSGTVYFQSYGNVIDCNFNSNSAQSDGGAVYFYLNGDATNCNFINNKVISPISDGGALSYREGEGTVTNCYFEGNSARYGGAIRHRQDRNVIVDTCILKTSSDTIEPYKSENIRPPILTVDNFTTFDHSGENLTFDLKMNSSIPVYDGNISISVYYKNNNSWVGNYSCLSGEKWAVDLPAGIYYAIFDTEYVGFKPINRTITVVPINSFYFLNHYIINANDNPAVNLSYNFYFYPDYDEDFVNGIMINRPVTINGNGNTIDAKGQARIFNVQSEGTVIKNLTLKNANFNGDGGALYFDKASIEIINCNFINNTAKNGGAVYFKSEGTVKNSNFTNNNVSGDGGVVYIGSGSVDNCNFINNTAKNGGAVYFKSEGTVKNSNFTNNNVSGDGGAVYFKREGNVKNSNFTNNNVSGDGGAVYIGSGSVDNCNFINNNATLNGGAVYIVSGSVDNSNFTGNNAKYGGAVSFRSEGILSNCIFTDNNAPIRGGAVLFWYDGDVTNCNFTDNTASEDGGAVYFSSESKVINSIFTGNNATRGSAIHFYSDLNAKSVYNSIFLNNRANVNVDNPFNVSVNDNDIEITFMGLDNLVNAIYSDGDVSFSNVTYWGAEGITNTDISVPVRSNNEAGQNITIVGVVNSNIVNTTKVTDENGKVVIGQSGDYSIVVSHDEDSYYSEAQAVFTNMKFNVNVTSFSSKNKTVNITAKSNVFYEVIPVELQFILPDGAKIDANYSSNGIWWATHTFDDYAEYNVSASFVGLDDVTVNNGTITINNPDSTIILDDVVVEYGESQKVMVETEGAVGITAKIDENDVDVDNFTILIPVLAAGNYTSTVTTIPDEDHNSVTKKVNLTVKKANTNIDVENTNVTMDALDSVDVNATLNPKDAGNLTFISSSPDVADVINGKIIANRSGTVIITVSFAGNENYTAAESKTINVTVKKINTSIEVVNKSLELKVDDESLIKATLTPADAGALVYTSNNSSVVTVDENGNVKAAGEGNATITVSFAGDDRYAAAESQNVSVSVSKIPTNITVDEKHLNLIVNENSSVSAKLSPAGAGKLSYESSNESVVIVDENGNIKAVGEGNATITVGFAGNDKYAVAESQTVDVSVFILVVPTEIIVKNTNVTMNALDSVEVNATLNPEDAGNLTFTSSNPDVAEVKDGKIIAKAKGNATITVSFAGNDKYAAAENKTITVTVNINDACVSAENIEMNVGANATIKATTTPEALPITYKVDNSGVVSVDDNGTVTALKEGEAKIILTVGDNKIYAINTTTITVTVKKIDTSIEVENKSLELKIDDESQIKATLTPPEAGKLNFTSSDESIVTIDDNGNVKAVSKGTATITVSFDGNDKYAASEDVTVTVNVSKIDTSIELDVDSINLTVYEEAIVVAKLIPSEAGNVTFTSSNESIVTVDSKGNAVAVGAGEATITASFTGDDKYKSAENVTIPVKVSKIDTKINVEPKSLDLKVDDETFIKTTLTPVKAGKVKFKSTNISVVSVDDEGNVMAVSEGTAVIIAYYDGDKNYNPAENVTIEVIVSKFPTKISVDEESLDLRVGDDSSVTARLSPVVAGKLSYKSGDESVVTVDDNGNVKAVGEGNAVIIVSFAGDDKYAAAESQSVAVGVSKISTMIFVDEESLDLRVGDDSSVTARLSPVVAGKLSYKSGDESVVTVDDNGNVRAVGAGNAVIIVGFAGDDKYAAAESQSVAVGVSKISTMIFVDEESLDLRVGDDSSVTARLSPVVAGKLSYKSGDESVVTVDDNGIVKAVGEGNAIITVGFAGDDKYAAAESQSVAVGVSKISTMIFVDEESLDLRVGDDSSITAKLSPPGAGKLSYKSSDESVVTVDENGDVKAVGEGNAVITVSFAGSDKYAAAESQSVAVGVSKISTMIFVDEESLDLRVGDDSSITAKLSPPGAGKLSYKSSDESVVTVDDNGIVKAVGEGNAVITVSFAGSDKYAAAESQSVAVGVSKISTRISVDEESLDLRVGDDSSITARLSPPGAGKLSYKSSDESVVTVDDNGNVRAVGAGNAVITVSFAGSDKYAAAESQSVAVSVSKIPTSINVKDVKVDLNVGDSKDVGASLTPADAGQLTYKSSNEKVVKVENGKLVAVAEGTATITVSFDGNNKYEASKDKTISVTVNLKDASVIAEPDSLELSAGESREFYVETTPEDLNIVVSSSNESVATVKLVNRVPTVTAVGEGSAVITITINEKDYVKNSTAVAVTVSKIPTTISAEVGSDLSVGDNSNVKYTLTPSDATGKVSFKSSNSKVLTVDAKGNVKAVGEGSATITVTYAGNSKYAPSNTTVSVKVSKSEIKPEIKQNDTTLTVGVPEDATGDVTVTIGNKTIKAPIKDGIAVIDFSDVPAGDYNITVNYPGDGKYSGFDVVVSVSIESEFQLIAENLTKYYHGAERFAVKALDGKGNPISGAEVKIFVNGMTYTRVTDENGSASIGVNMESGEYIATVSCNNITVEATITVLPTVNGTDLVKVFRNATQYYATFRDSQGNYLKDGTTVRFNIHGVFYDRQISGDKGLAKLNINLEQGEYIITAINLETGESRANNITVLPRIVENYDLTKYYRNASQYTVKIIGDDGNPVGAGENVTFNINGVFYTRTTNGSGIAKLNINLQKGDYIITAGYKNCVVSNKIKVLPILTAKDLTKKYGTKDQFVANLVDGQGKAYADQSVQFNINGVFYNRVTDANGQAKLNINLQPGEYIITSSYNGASIANKVTVTA